MVIWKEIQGLEGIYEVSNLGEVRRMKTGLILKPHKRKDGRLYLLLSANGCQYQVVVSRIVAFAFIENMNRFMQVNFINGDKTDSRLNNLSICHKSGRIAGKNANNANNGKKLILSSKTGIYYDSIKDLHNAEYGNISLKAFYKRIKRRAIRKTDFLYYG